MLKELDEKLSEERLLLSRGDQKLVTSSRLNALYCGGQEYHLSPSLLLKKGTHLISTFTDSGQTLEDFAETMYVSCPNCHKRAQVKRISTDEGMILTDDTGRYGSWRFRRSFSPRKVTCLHCSYTRIWKGKARGARGPYDWYFGLPLWLQTPCCGKILWTFNEEHLSFLERYVMAKQRLKFSAAGQIRNATMASRLPSWIKSAKNRDGVLKGIARLKKMLEKS